VTIGVIVVAAGSGSRLGHAEPKAFVPLGGRTILEWSLDSVFGMSEPAQVVIVAPASRMDAAADLARRAAGPVATLVRVVAGGASRQASVAAGLAVLENDVDIVLVHDSARPFTPSDLFDRVVARVRETGEGVVPGLPVADTLKRVDDGLAVATVDRAQLSAVQTPQGFPRAALVEAYAAASADYTDDAALFAAAGHPVHLEPGDAHGFKITTAWDLRRAASLVSPGGFRVGQGIDVHAYDEGEPLWLGDLYWPDEPGLAGHSDGDALSHSLCDALLSAAGLGDVGGRFGTGDPRFAGAHGQVFIAETIALVAGAGYRVENVAVQIVANRPRLASRRTELEKHLSDLVGAPVSVSATTSDGLGYTGRGEGLAAYATALLTLTG
jgi:2-C-methyl-D-erythritol 4-phosphate cytidylyltransferase/2-C-methyl-D-erythritol 2,4-cyclodiphosphate synthase